MAREGAENVQLFADSARGLIDVLREPPLHRDDAARTLRRKLAHVYASALNLTLGGENFGAPELDEAFPVSEETLALVRENVADVFGNDRYYWMQFEPRFTGEDGPEPVLGDLADDFGDIYRDIVPALLAWESKASRIDDILFEWCGVPFTTHWGVHAVQALTAMHKLRS